MGKKVAITLLTIAVVVGIVSAGYFFFQRHMKQQQAAAACVATAFPMVVIEHNKSSIENLLQDLRSDGDKKASSAQDKKKSYILSKQIDEKFLKLAEKIKKQKGSDKAQSLQKSKKALSKEFKSLVSVFDHQAPEYLNECVSLFTEIADQCGDFEALTQGKSKECVKEYKPQVAQLMSKHIKNKSQKTKNN